MSRRSRRFESGKCYELCFRVRSGLPFATLRIIDLILKSSIARANRGGRVTICHMVWMGNHPHILIRVFDAKAAKDFYMELQKKITEAMKRLLGLEHLQLWEGKPQVAVVLELEKVIQRIVYFYLNPSRANLVENIGEYPGLNSWKAFNESFGNLNAEITTKVPWIQQPTIKKLSSRRVTEPEDCQLTKELIRKATTYHDLSIKPNEWMKAFGVNSPEEVKQINDQIIRQVKAGEAEYAAGRLSSFCPERQKLPKTLIIRAKSAERGSKIFIASDI